MGVLYKAIAVVAISCLSLWIFSCSSEDTTGNEYLGKWQSLDKNITIEREGELFKVQLQSNENGVKTYPGTMNDGCIDIEQTGRICFSQSDSSFLLNGLTYKKRK